MFRFHGKVVLVLAACCFLVAAEKKEQMIEGRGKVIDPGGDGAAKKEEGKLTVDEHAGEVPVANGPPVGPKALPAQAADAMDEKIEPEKLRADFRIARQALEEGHSGIYRYTSKVELDRLFDQAEKSLTKPMSMLEFYRVLAPVVAAIKCGHTGVYLPKDYLKTYTAKNGILPLQVRVLAGKAYVWRDLSGAPASLAGKEIRTINGVPGSKIVEKMLAATSGDGDIQTNRMWRLGRWTFSSELLALAGLPGPHDLCLWDAMDKREIKVHLEGANTTRLEETARAKFPQDQDPQNRGRVHFPGRRNDCRHEDSRIWRICR